MTSSTQRSFWINQCQDTVPSTPVSGELHVDVAVVGAGIFGTSTALRLIEEGKTVVLIDQSGVGQGVTGHSTCKISSLHRLVYADLAKAHGMDAAKTFGFLNEEAIAEIDRNIKRFGIECDYSRRDAVTFTLEDSFVNSISDEVDIASQCGLKASFAADVGLPFPVKAAIKVTDQAQFNAYAYCVGIANEFVKKGGQVFQNTRVTGVKSLKAPHTVEMESGTVVANHVVIATHLPILDRSGHFGICSPSASYCIAYHVATGVTPPLGMYVTAEKERTRSIRTAANNTILLVGGNSHPLGEARDGNTEHEYEELDHWARTHLPVGEFIERWSSEDYQSPDNLPYIGYLHHGTSSMYTATGFKKWGFTTGVLAAKIVTDLIMERDPPGHALLDARRWDINKSALGIMKTGVHVAKHMVKDRAEHLLKPMDIEDLANGCGGVCKYKNKTVAAYKDENGQVHAVSPTCTHLGCHIVWNQGERLWDCPCHGSRFDIAGHVLHGPAVKDLERYE